ncbi:Isoquinoline 1-oxidoreductase subunit [Massilia sp. KIM]|uniref:Isoquinoline 1-oxidoreductase subunit n=1 Tax=Massilia sp. KIM TaxID=1955422 RepID=UPI00098F3C93|nr:Isoquinoline 1-oxidoreductase subunit [Massilia sp. KIM]OON63264.1 Isoquinoline 1-oxidoreductase subunit [Massilia sp. KIM]
MKTRLLLSLAFCAACLPAGAQPSQVTPPGTALKAPSDFQNVQDQRARSQALFIEAGKVINHPRCLNCHPNGKVPTQGEDLHAHIPPVHGGPDGKGRQGLLCVSCHQAKNVEATGTAFRAIPGHEHWHLAPLSMAWQGKSLGEICEQLKDTTRNGGRNLKQISEHMGKDSLVGWAWRPHAGREPAPGTQKLFGELIQAWIDTGAHCPR